MTEQPPSDTAAAWAWLTASVRAEAAGADRRMTLGELRAFVDKCDRLEVGDDMRLDVRTKGLGALRSIETRPPR